MRLGVVMGSKRTVWEVHDFVAMGFERYVNHTSLVFPSFFRLFLKILIYRESLTASWMCPPRSLSKTTFFKIADECQDVLSSNSFFQNTLYYIKTCSYSTMSSSLPSLSRTIFSKIAEKHLMFFPPRSPSKILTLKIEPLPQDVLSFAYLFQSHISL
jgi:hypothetical protein